MFLKIKSTGDLILIENPNDLAIAGNLKVRGLSQAGEEQQEVEVYEKHDLQFPSGEELPRCWTDPNYKELT